MLSDQGGLDLRKTDPPIGEVLARLASSQVTGPVFVAIMAVPEMVAASVDEVIRGYQAFPTLRAESPTVAARIDYLLVQIG